MPSFLSKVFGRKKDDRDSSPTNQPGPGELLGGKFEAISPNVSPSATRFLELQSDPPKLPVFDEFGLPFFRTKSRPSSPEAKPKRLFDSLPPLSLDFDDLKDKSAYNGYIFEESNSEAIFSNNALGQRRLNPMEALVLIDACSKAIISRGLETLGIMTPHWYSASTDVQRRLISNFLRSLDLKSSTAAVTPSSPYNSDFEDQINLTRSIHDVAAVFRWGLRHLQLEGDSFGTDDGWYKAFLDAEAANGYPPKAFSEKLGPSLPTSHLDLITSTLEVFSSLGAFSEANSTSGSKLCKIFGLWLLTARRVEDGDDWRAFYARWERTGRMLEHLFLARIRDQSTDQRMPTRLLDLVRKYPYTHGLSHPTTDLQLLPYPQFTTALHPALFVRVQYEVPSQRHIPKTRINPSIFLADAFSTKVEEGEFVELWGKIINTASKTGTEFPLGNVFANETLRLLSLVADKSKEEVKSPTFSLMSLAEPRQQQASSSGAASVKPTTESAPLTTTAPLSPINIGGDWAQFSASGFLDDDQTFPPLASTLFDTDVEKTEPRDFPLPISRKSSKRAGRKSLEFPRSVVIAESSGHSEAANLESFSKERQEVITASHMEVIELDEAFVDFWSDALLDPIASDWPTFVVCKFKPTLVPDLTFGIGDEATKKTLKWLVLEQVYSVKPRPVLPTPLTTIPTPVETPARSASPVAQTPSGRRFFNFWTLSRTPSASSTGSQRPKKVPKTPNVGEMGELIEEDEGKRDTINVRLPSSKKFKSLDLPAVKRLAVKKADKLEEKAKSVEVTRLEFPGTDIDAGAASPAIAASAAAAAGATATVELSTEKQESDVVNEVALSTPLEPVAESSEPVTRSKPTDDVPVSAEAEVALVDIEREDVSISAAPLEQEAQIIDAVAAAEPAIVSIPQSSIVADEQETGEPAKVTIIEEDTSRHPEEEVDLASPSVESHQPLSPEVSLHVQQPGEVEQAVPIASTIGALDLTDGPMADEATHVSEECQLPIITTEVEPVEIFQTAGEELEGVSEEPQLGAREEAGISESFSLTEAATTTVSASPGVETRLTEPDTRTGEPVEDAVEEDVPLVEVKPEVFDTLAVADEVPAQLAETVEPDHDTAIPTSETAPIVVNQLITVQEAHAAEACPEPNERESFVGEISESAVDAPAEAVEDKETPIAIEEMESCEALAEDTPAAADNVVVEEVTSTEFSAGVEVSPILDDASTSTIPAANVDPEIVVPLETLEDAVGEAGAVDVVETISAEIVVGTFVEPAFDEFQAPDAPVEDVAEKLESSVETPIHELLEAEAEPFVETIASQDTTQLLSTEAETPEERSQEVSTVEPETAAEVPIDEMVDVGMQETTADDEVPVSEESTEEPPIDEARETLAYEDMSSSKPSVLETPSVAVEPEPEIPPTELLSDESLAQPLAEAPEAVAAAEDEKICIQPEISLAEPQTQIVEPYEEPAIETRDNLSAAEPDLPVEEPEMLVDEVSTEVLQVMEETDAANDAALVEDATLAAEKDEAVVLETSEREVVSSTPEIPVVGEELPLEAPEQAEESLEVALPLVTDARVEQEVRQEEHRTTEVTLPQELFSAECIDEVTVTSEEVRVAEETPVFDGGAIEDAPERTTETATESDEPALETAIVSEAAASITEEVIPVTAEDSGRSVVTEPAVDVPMEAQLVPGVSTATDPPEIVEDAFVVEESLVPVDEAVTVENPIDAAEEVPAVNETVLVTDGAPEQFISLSFDTAPPTVEAAGQEPSVLDTSPVEEPLVAETFVAQETPPAVEETITEELPPSDEPRDIVEVIAESPPDPEVGASPLADAEETSAAVGGSSDAVEEMPSVLPVDAEPLAASAEDEALDAAAEGSPEVSQPQAEAAESFETSPAPELTSELQVEASEQEDNTTNDPKEVLTDIDQPIHSLETANPTVEGGIMDELIVVESATGNGSSVEKPNEITGPDELRASTTTDISNEEELVHNERRNEGASISENGVVEPAAEITPSSFIDPPTLVEPDTKPGLLPEPSPELDPPPTEQAEQPVVEKEELPAISEHTDVALMDANQSANPNKAEEVPTSIEATPAVYEPTLVQSEEPASELLDRDGHIYMENETTDFAVVATDDDDEDPTNVDSLVVDDGTNTALQMLKDGKVATDEPV